MNHCFDKIPSRICTYVYYLLYLEILVSFCNDNDNISVCNNNIKEKSRADYIFGKQPELSNLFTFLIINKLKVI